MGVKKTKPGALATPQSVILKLSNRALQQVVNALDN